MKLRKVLAISAALVVLVAAAGCIVLVPSEAERPPPAGMAEPKLVPLAVPFTHKWAKATSHPLLAAIDIDGDGRDAVFLGGSDGQPDALLAWRDDRLVDIAADVGLGDTTATYGALSLDLDGDGRTDLVWANMDGAARAYLNKTDCRFVAVRLPDAPASIGARIRLEGVPAPVQVFIAGEGLTSDRTTQYSFGLAKDAAAPAALVVEWPGGKITRVPLPPENKPIAIAPP